MYFYFMYHPEKDLKIVFKSPTLFLVKMKNGDGSIVVGYNTENAKMGIGYFNPNIDNLDNSLNGLILENYGTIVNRRDEQLPDGSITSPRENRQLYFQLPTDPSDFPFFPYVAVGETETDETPTKTIVFPPPETTEQFLERIYARLLHLTRRIKVLRHEEPHQNALSEKICREVPENHDEVLRYDIACNLIKRPCGWLALQLENYQTRYNRHLEAVVKAKEAGRTPPTFNRGNDETTIETMLEKLETNLTEECLQEHFDRHDHAEWDRIQNKQRKITLCDDDYSPGELLVDVNSFFTDGRGRVAETHAKKTYHDISTQYWVKAKRTPHRNLVTQRTVELN